MSYPTPSSYTTPPLKPHFFSSILFRASLHPSPFHARPLGELDQLYLGKERGGGKDLRPGRASVSRAPLAPLPALHSARRWLAPAPARRSRRPEAVAGRGRGWGPGMEAGEGERGAPLPSSPPSPSPPTPFIFFFFLPSSLASLSPLESEGASRLGAGAGYVSQTVTCSLPVSFSCVLK